MRLVTRDQATLGEPLVSEKLIVDSSVKAVKTTERAMEGLVRKAWSVMDAAAEKQKASQYLSDPAIRSMQGKE